jgi:hypothetical protein
MAGGGTGPTLKTDGYDVRGTNLEKLRAQRSQSWVADLDQQMAGGLLRDFPDRAYLPPGEFIPPELV